MSDGKTKRGAADRSRVAAQEPYEVSYVARNYGITTKQAKELIVGVGGDRAKLEAAAERLK